MENNENYEKLSGVLRKFLGNAFTLDGKEDGISQRFLFSQTPKKEPAMRLSKKLKES